MPDRYTDKELLIRLEERLNSMERTIDALNTQIETKLANFDKLNVLANEFSKSKLDNLERKFDKYVTTTEFIPVQRVVYGMVGLILTSTLVAIGHLLLGKNP